MNIIANETGTVEYSRDNNDTARPTIKQTTLHSNTQKNSK